MGAVGVEALSGARLAAESSGVAGLEMGEVLAPEALLEAARARAEAVVVEAVAAVLDVARMAMEVAALVEVEALAPVGTVAEVSGVTTMVVAAERVGRSTCVHRTRFHPCRAHP